MRNVIRIEKHRLRLPGHWGADLDTQGLMHLLSQTALLTLDFCDNYKALREMSCAVTFLPKQPGGPGKLDCHWLETKDSDPLRCNVQERYIPIMRLSLWRFLLVPSSDRGGRQGTMLTGLRFHPEYGKIRSLPCPENHPWGLDHIKCFREWNIGFSREGIGLILTDRARLGDDI